MRGTAFSALNNRLICVMLRYAPQCQSQNLSMQSITCVLQRRTMWQVMLLWIANDGLFVQLVKWWPIRMSLQILVVLGCYQCMIMKCFRMRTWWVEKKGLPEGGQLRYLIRMLSFFQLSCCKNKSLVVDYASNSFVIKWLILRYIESKTACEQ